MSVVLRQSLELIGSYLAPPLFPADAMSRLCDAAQVTTSDVRLGLECRLDDTPAPADLSQMIDVADGGAERLRLLARARARGGDERTSARGRSGHESRSSRAPPPRASRVST
jgi:hypothetical protein